MIGNDLAGRKQLLQWELPHTKRRCGLIREKRVIDAQIQPMLLQQTDQRPANHASAKNTDRRIEATGHLPEPFQRPVASFRRPTGAHGIMKSLVCKQDLRCGILCDRDGICRPGRKNVHTCRQKFPSKVLHRAGRIKHCAQRGKAFLKLLACKMRHIPCGENQLRIAVQVRLCQNFFPCHRHIRKLRPCCQPCTHGCGKCVFTHGRITDQNTFHQRHCLSHQASRTSARSAAASCAICSNESSFTNSSIRLRVLPSCRMISRYSCHMVAPSASGKRL